MQTPPTIKPGISEEWRDIPGCEGTYSISNRGNVKSIERWVVGGKGKKQFVPEKLLKQPKDSDGYRVVSIRFNDGSRRVMKVHRLVLLAFLGNTNLMCCHNDGDKDNNHLTNLRYGTAQDNADDRTKHGSKVGALGEGNGAAKLTEAKVREIKELLSSNLSCPKIAEMFDVCAESIRKIATNKTWKHV